MEPTYLACEYDTFWELVEYLMTFGLRYRIWQGDKALAPSELISHFTPDDPVHMQRCALEREQVERDGKTISGNRIWYLSSEAGQGAQSPSPYFLEDLLALATVVQWVEQQEPEQVIAELHRDAQLSTFLEHYYQDVLGFVPENLATTRLPLWCAYLEGLLHGLNPNGRLERIEVPAEVVFAWLGEIGFIFISAQADSDCGVDLDDGEEVDQGLWAAVETGQPSC